MQIVTLKGGSRGKLCPSQQVFVAVVFLAARLSGHRRRRPRLRARGDRAPLSRRASGLIHALCEGDAEYTLVDGTLADCDRVGDGRADHSGKHCRRGVNLPPITDARGKIVWISLALTASTHDLIAAPAPTASRSRAFGSAFPPAQIRPIPRPAAPTRIPPRKELTRSAGVAEEDTAQLPHPVMLAAQQR
ncbi:hypothetical protein ACFYW6_40170 [Streptomyces sp. NPDC002659]|uniref:hypothetical protein n=1 Tax=Streptomyces sp. NPDC002659 TaxID=3364656 RepID=UPI003692FC40